MNNVNWISKECLDLHTEKHVKQNFNEAEKWNKLYSSSPYFTNREKLIEDKNENELRDIYEDASKKVHFYKSKIYLYLDEKTGEFKANLSRNLSRKKDTLVIGEIVEHDKFKINTCFFKINEYIDTEILSMLVKLDKEFQKGHFRPEELGEILTLKDNGVYVYKNKKLINTYSDIIVGVPDISALPYCNKNGKKIDKELYRRRDIAKRILIVFLENQCFYKKTYSSFLYNYIIDAFSSTQPLKNEKHSKAKGMAQKNINNIIRIHNWSKSYDEYIEYTEMSVIFNLLCLYISCKALGCTDEYHIKYDEVENKIFNEIPNQTKNYDIITNLILDNFEE